MMLFNPRSRNFRKGFIDGFSAHASALDEISFPRASSIDASLKSAWIKVGKALKEADKRERENLGKTSNKAA